MHTNKQETRESTSLRVAPDFLRVIPKVNLIYVRDNGALEEKSGGTTVGCIFSLYTPNIPMAPDKSGEQGKSH